MPLDETSFTPIAPAPTSVDIPPLATMEPSFAEYVGSQFESTLRDNGYGASFIGMMQLERANRGRPSSGLGPFHPSNDPTLNPMPDRTMSASDLGLMAAEQGVDLPNLGTGKYTLDAATIMLDRAKRRAVNEQNIAAYNPSWGTAAVTSLLASVADPLNVAAAFIPFVGEARYGAWLAEASGLAGRTAVRFGTGAIEGGLGAAVLEPLLAEASTQEGRDYQLADSMRNMLFGTVFGAGMHATLGAGGELLFKRHYTLTEPPLSDSVDLINRLPVEINEVAVRAAISDLVHGRPVQSGEILDGFIKTNPDLAEAISYAATLRRGGPELDDVPGRIGFWEQQLEALKTAPKKPVSFLTWLRSKGGLRDVDNDIKNYLSDGDTSHLGKAYISQAGAAKTERGLTFDDLFEQARTEGYVKTREELRRAFEKDANRVRQSDADLIAAHQESREYVQRMLTESGVNPKTKNSIKARAIAGREQHIVASERARLSSIMDRLAERQADYRTIAEGGKPEVVRSYQPEAGQAAKDEGVAVGDTVVTTDEKGNVNLSQERRVAKIVEDKVYGRHVFFEGEPGGYPANQLQIVKRAPVPEATAGVEAAKAVEAPKAPTTVEPKEYTFEQIAQSIADAFGVTGNRPVFASQVMLDLPGISKNKFRDAAGKLIRSGDLESAGLNPAGEVLLVKARRLSDTEIATQQSHKAKLEQARRNLDERFPNMAKEKTYYLQSLVTDQMDALELGPTNTQNELNKAIREKRLRAFDEETGEELKSLDSRYFHMDTVADQPGVLLTFSEPTAPTGRKPLPSSKLPMSKSEIARKKLGALSEEEKVKLQLQEPSPPVPPEGVTRVETPPADREALNAKELEQSATQYNQLQESTLRRFEAMANQLPPEVAASLRAQLAKIGDDADELAKVFNSAVSCLLNPR